MGCYLTAVFVWTFVVVEREKFENCASNRLVKYSGTDNSRARFRHLCSYRLCVYFTDVPTDPKWSKKKKKTHLIQKKRNIYIHLKRVRKTATQNVKQIIHVSYGLLNWSDVFQLYVLFIVKLLLRNVEL